VTTEAIASPIEGVALDETPPCEVVFRNKATGHSYTCAKPSVVRVRIHCNTCSYSDTVFLCAGCWADARKGTLDCAHCFRAGRPANDCTYRES
jgi:hypothetical protein